jgi:hypothetical protein
MWSTAMDVITTLDVVYSGASLLLIGAGIMRRTSRRKKPTSIHSQKGKAYPPDETSGIVSPMTLGSHHAKPLRLARLASFRRQMLAQSATRAMFRYRTRKAELEVAYIIDVDPNVLLIGVTGVTPFAFEVEVDRRGQVIPFLAPGDLGALLDALGVERGPERRFSVRGFFEYLDSRVPEHAGPVDAPQPDFVARFWDDVEEADKVYFVGWRNNPVGAHVTAENLAKTERLIGRGAREACARLNISSCWTADWDDRRLVTRPPQV